MRPSLLLSLRRAATAAMAAAMLSGPASSAGAQAPAELDRLYAIADSIRVARQPRLVADVPDFSPAAIGRWRDQLAALRSALATVGTEGWSVPNRIDHILVRTQLNAWDFELRVQRPWERDPGHWVDLIARLPYTATPIASGDEPRVRVQLRAVSAILEAARRSLTAPSAELAGIALFHLTQSDGVNQGEPRRDPPPAGVIGWYEEFVQRVAATNPTLSADAGIALAAVRAFRDWLHAEQPRMTEPAYIGLEEYAWYVRNVRLLPLTVEQIRALGERELERARMLLAIERHRNRELPEQVPVTNAAEHEQRTRAAETLIRDFTRRERILTIPADIPPIYETDAFFIDRSAWGGARHFWEEITYRDPLNNHIHASIPGHRFDGTLQRRHPSPIRRAFSDGTRAEGWSFYIEEMYLQAGLLKERPRTRELFYIAQLKRAARIRAELAMQTGQFTLQQAIDFLNAEVPLMESNLARYDLAIYLRRPAYGMNYTVGKAQMERLLSDYKRQQGDAFSLGAFHDAFLASGSIPITLIRWQMTGLEDEVRALGLMPQTDTLASVSIDRFYSWPSLIGTEPRGAAWSPDSRTIAFLWNDRGMPFLNVWAADAVTGALTQVTALPQPPVATNPPGYADAMPAAYADQRAAIAAEMDGGIASVQWHRDGQRLLIARGGQWYLVRRAGERNAELPAPLNTGGPAQRAEFSPDGSMLAFIRGGDIHVAPLVGDTLGPSRRVTAVAREGVGVESVAWSPDGTHMAFVETDRTAIPVREIPDYLPDDAVMTRVRRAYPGEPSEMRRLGVVEVSGPPAAAVRWMSLGDERSDLIFTYSWHPTAKMLLVDKSDVFVKDRRLLTLNATTGAAVELMREQEPTNVSAEWRAAWAPDGRGVYFVSDRDTDYHVWYVPVSSMGGAAPPRAITRGAWAVFGMQMTPRGILVTANTPRAEERTLYMVPLGGGAMRRVSVRSGTHTATASPDGRYAAVIFSSDTIPPDLYVTALGATRVVATGSASRSSAERQLTVSPSAIFADYTWPAPRYVTFPSRTDGVMLHGRLIMPRNAVPGERVPVVVGSIYSNTVRNQWGGRNAHPLWGLDRVLLERGYALFAVDVAGSSGHGTEFRRRILLDYGGVDVEDIHSGVEWLIREGIADSSRVAIWGSSYGGLLTSMSLFKKPGVYKAGIAAAPATNVWHALTGEQRVMARPQEQMQAYANASSHTQAAGARDALMFVHGMRDNIVLYRDSVWLLQYLMQLGQTVEFVTLPDAPHGWDLGPHYQTRFAFHRMVEFLDRHLKGPEPQ